MKTLFKLILSLTLITSLVLINSCGKYDDGPKFSLRSKKARLTGEWEVDEKNGKNISYNWTFEFKKDGTFEEDKYNDDRDGDWEWEDGRTIIELDYDHSGKNEWEVLRLTNKELWIEDEYGVELRLEKE